MSPGGESKLAELHPSPWVKRFTRLIRPGGKILDVAAGRGRHVHWFVSVGYRVVAVDRNVSSLKGLDPSRVRVVEADLEVGKPWPLQGELFDAVVVTNYLHRGLFADLLRALHPAGVLIYETFASGNEAWGRPSNPDFLLNPGELLKQCGTDLNVVAYEHGLLPHQNPRVVQRVCALGQGRSPGLAELD